MDNENKAEETVQTETAETPGTEETPVEETRETEEVKEEVNPLEEKLKEREKEYLYLRAEYDNFRRRSAKEKTEAYSKAKADAAEKFLPVYDNLERALQHGSEDEAFLKGVEMTMNQLKQVLESLDIHPIEAVGQPFDPNLHNAVMHIDDPELGENVVAACFQTGFKMGDKVIRFAMVQVAN
jgi:molecular chaperone GrpE